MSGTAMSDGVPARAAQPELGSGLASPPARRRVADPVQLELDSALVSRRPRARRALPESSARAVLAEGIRALSAAGLPMARQDAEWLLANLLRVDRFALYTKPPAMTAAEVTRYREALARRAAREPLQYLLGWEEWRGLRFRVGAEVFIPRPETELLVEWALTLTPRGATACDVGTGSGCIACAIAAERPDVRVIAVDLSQDALSIAAENVNALGLRDRVALLAGDLLQPLVGRTRAVDVIVANPPYIPSGVIATLPDEVREWEPRGALDGGADGMAVSRRIISAAAAVLDRGGAVVMEIGEGQASELSTMMRAAGFLDVATRRDFNQVERYIAGRLPLPRAGAG